MCWNWACSPLQLAKSKTQSNRLLRYRAFWVYVKVDAVYDLAFARLERSVCVIQEGVPKHKGWLQNAAQPQKPPGAATQDIMIPLEFKTGKPFNGHNAQVQPTY